MVAAVMMEAAVTDDERVAAVTEAAVTEEVVEEAAMTAAAMMEAVVSEGQTARRDQSKSASECGASVDFPTARGPADGWTVIFCSWARPLLVPHRLVCTRALRPFL